MIMQVRRHPKPLAALFCAAVLASFGAASCAREAARPPEPARYTVEVGGEFAVSLPANRTTGFSWALGAPLDTDLLALVEQRYIGPESTLPGAGGRSEWRFRGVAPGATQLTFIYRRPWEEGVAPARTMVYSVLVEPAPAGQPAGS